MNIRDYSYLALDQKSLRLINRANVLTAILKNEPVSRVRITELTGLNKSTVSNVIKEFIDDGLICVQGNAKSAMGRKPINLRIKERYAIYGVINVGLTRSTVAVCDLRGKVLDCQELDTPKDAEKFLHSSAESLSHMLNAFRNKVAGISVILPFPFDSRSGRVIWSRCPEWEELPVKSILEQHLQVKVLVECDAWAGARAEYFFGSGRKFSNFVFVKVCERISIGIVLSKRIYKGAHFNVGELGIQKWRTVRQESGSDNEILWEDVASNRGIVNRFEELTGEKSDKNVEERTEQIIQLAGQGDQRAVTALKETAWHLGACISGINWVIDPENIIIGGQIIKAWDLIYPELTAALEANMPYQVTPIKNLLSPGTVARPDFEGARALILQEILMGMDLLHQQHYPRKARIEI